MTITTPVGASADTTPPRAEIATITPEIAAEWLNLNTHNRPLADYRVKMFARDMEAGNWQLTGEAIKFDVNGTLLDGQHRLWACVESDTPFDCFVVTGLPAESQEVMDTGQKRTAGQVLGLRGMGNPNHVAAVATMIFQWNTGQKFRDITTTTSRMISHAEIIKVVEENPGIGDAIAFASARSIPGTSLSARAFTLHLLRGIDKEAADQFFAELSAMQTTGYGDPKSALLRRLAAAVRDQERIDRYTQSLVLIRVWNAVRKGEEMQRVMLRSSTGELLRVDDPV